MSAASSAESGAVIASLMENPYVRQGTAHLVVFDYDDTILCSTYINSLGLCLKSTDAQVEQKAGHALRKLADSARCMLERAMTCSPVAIITNAERGWVEMATIKFLPSLVPLLSRIVVISARTAFEPLFPDSPVRWKYYAFDNFLKTALPPRINGAPSFPRQFISLGDSLVEREAARDVCLDTENDITLHKSIKFSERPTMEQLQRQQELVYNCYGYIFGHTGNLDLQLVIPTQPTPISDDSQTKVGHDTTTSPTMPLSPQPSLPRLKRHYKFHTSEPPHQNHASSAPISIPRTSTLRHKK